MKKKLGSIFVSLFLLTACESIDEDLISKVELDGNAYHLLFFSDEDFIESEENYYDVLLDLRKQFPNEMAKLNLYLVQSSNQDELKKFQVDTYPTLLLYKDGDVVSRIEGKQSKEDILENLLDSIH